MVKNQSPDAKKPDPIDYRRTARRVDWRWRRISGQRFRPGVMKSSMFECDDFDRGRQRGLGDN